MYIESIYTYIHIYIHIYICRKPRHTLFGPGWAPKLPALVTSFPCSPSVRSAIFVVESGCCRVSTSIAAGLRWKG